jgi:hypothetical protein
MQPELLNPECAVFTRYLVNQPVNAYLASQYVQCHQSISGMQEKDAFDRSLLAFARRGPRFAQIADAYASRFRKDALLRKKLVLLLGLLEVSPPYFRQIEEPHPAPLAHLLKLAVAYPAALLAGILLLCPVHLIQALRHRPGQAERA